MNTEVLAPQMQADTLGAPVQQRVTAMVDHLMDQLPNPALLTAEERRGSRRDLGPGGEFHLLDDSDFPAVHSEEARPILMNT